MRDDLFDTVIENADFSNVSVPLRGKESAGPVGLANSFIGIATVSVPLRGKESAGLIAIFSTNSPTISFRPLAG